MEKTTLLMALAALGMVGLAPAGDAKKDLEAMQGIWKVESIKESFGKAPPDDVIKEFVVTIKDDTMKVSRGGQTVVAFKMKLDTTKDPKTIDFTHAEGPDKDKTEPGIYKLEGDTLTLCTTDFGKERPTVFATKEGTRNSLAVLKKAK
jgi:uncharacterized protein (TIGR03067 family)